MLMSSRLLVLRVRNTVPPLIIALGSSIGYVCIGTSGRYRNVDRRVTARRVGALISQLTLLARIEQISRYGMHSSLFGGSRTRAGPEAEVHQNAENGAGALLLVVVVLGSKGVLDNTRYNEYSVLDEGSEPTRKQATAHGLS
jgi:hypothetical protein